MFTFLIVIHLMSIKINNKKTSKKKRMKHLKNKKKTQNLQFNTNKNSIGLLT